MVLQLGDMAPDFSADTTRGVMKFHEHPGDSWGIVFSRPGDFTPVCTTESGAAAKLKPESEERGVKLVVLSINTVESHRVWEADIGYWLPGRDVIIRLGVDDAEAGRLVPGYGTVKPYPRLTEQPR